MKRIHESCTGIVVNDEHSPFFDKNALEISLKIIEYVKPDFLLLNGDQLDFYELSTFDKNPARKLTLQDEIDIWHKQILSRQISASKKSTVIKIDGNHEDRLRRYLFKNPELFSLRSLSIENILSLKEFGVEYSKDGVLFQDTLRVYHGERVSKYSAYSAKAEMEKHQHTWSTITGHVHRVGKHVVTKPNGEVVTSVENGCLCSLKPEYLNLTNWQHGITYFEVFENEVFIQQLTIQRGKCILGKKLFSV